MEKALICITCPIGCHLQAVVDNEGGIIITGNKCQRGEVYGREEIKAPKRIVTAVVQANSQDLPCLPVKTDKPLLKQLIPGLLNRIYDMYVQVPVRLGDILIEDYEGSGVNVIFTRSAVK